MQVHFDELQQNYRLNHSSCIWTKLHYDPKIKF